MTCGKACTTKCTDLQSAATSLADTVPDEVLKLQLAQAAKAIQDALQGLLNAAKKDLNDPVANERFNVAATDCATAIQEVVVAASLTAEEPSPDDQIVKTARILRETGAKMGGAFDTANKAEIVNGARGVAGAATKLNTATKTFAGKLTDESLRNRLIAAGKSVMDATAEIIAAAKLDPAVPANKQGGLATIKKLGTKIDDVMDVTRECMQAYSGQEPAIDDDVERELHNAGRAIDQLLQQLEDNQAQAKEKESHFSLDEQKMSDILIDQCRDIAIVTSKLMKAAKESQRELTSLHKAAPKVATYLQDPSLKEGLIRTAKSVAGAIAFWSAPQTSRLEAQRQKRS
jgi:hypothetical protein